MVGSFRDLVKQILSFNWFFSVLDTMDHTLELREIKKNSDFTPRAEPTVSLQISHGLYLVSFGKDWLLFRDETNPAGGLSCILHLSVRESQVDNVAGHSDAPEPRPRNRKQSRQIPTNNYLWGLILTTWSAHTLLRQSSRNTVNVYIHTCI